MENNVIEKLLTYYKEHTDDFNEDLEEVDAYNGYLKGSRIFPMDELDEWFYSPLKALKKAFYDGYDEDSENENPKPFCPRRNYFYFDANGSMVSTDYKDYTANWLNELTVKIIANLYKTGELFLTQGAQEIINANSEN